MSSSSASLDVLIKPAADKVGLKLFINKKKKSILFAEAAKPFVDFLIHSFSLPFGTIVGSPEGSSSFDKLKGSIDHLDGHYFLPKLNKHIVLNPKASAQDSSNSLLSVYECRTAIDLYKCSQGSSLYIKCKTYLTTDPSNTCSSCGYVMSTKICILPQVPVDGGYVKDAMKYVVMDDLEVKPMSTMLMCTLLQRIDTENIEEKVVFLGKEEAMKLLKTSLRSDRVLTDMFMVKEED